MCRYGIKILKVAFINAFGNKDHTKERNRVLTFSRNIKTFSRKHLKWLYLFIYLLFFQKIGFDISFKLSQ